MISPVLLVKDSTEVAPEQASIAEASAGPGTFSKHSTVTTGSTPLITGAVVSTTVIVCVQVSVKSPYVATHVRTITLLQAVSEMIKSEKLRLTAIISSHSVMSRTGDPVSSRLPSWPHSTVTLLAHVIDNAGVQSLHNIAKQPNNTLPCKPSSEVTFPALIVIV